MTHTILDVAGRFAAALDTEDYSAARALIAESCIYRINDATLIGRDAIISSYRANAASATQRFDSVDYRSHVEATGSSTAVIKYTDRLRLGDDFHEFRCRQHVQIGAAGLIEQITHEELPGERQRLEAFESRLADR